MLLRGLNTQVTEAEEGPLELRRKKGRIYTPGGTRGGRHGHAPEWEHLRRGRGELQACSREREHRCWVLHLKGFYLKAEILGRVLGDLSWAWSWNQLRPRYYLYFDQNSDSELSRPEALLLRLLASGQNLFCPQGLMLRESGCKGLHGSCMRLFSGPLVSL